MADNVKIEGLIERREELERLLMKSPAMEKKVQKLIRKVLMQVRRRMGDNIPFKHGDPRKAYKAVKTAVYRQILGGNVSILNKRKRSTQFSNYEPPRTLMPGQRGGNRRARSPRTWDLIHYAGPDRGFVLRFINNGVGNRAIRFRYDEAREHVHRGSQGGHKYGETINTGFRGNIAPRNWFGNRSQREMERGAEELTKLIDDLIKQELK